MNLSHNQQPAMDVVARASELAREFAPSAKKNGVRLVARAAIRATDRATRPPCGSPEVHVYLLGDSETAVEEVKNIIPSNYPVEDASRSRYPVVIMSSGEQPEPPHAATW